MDNQNNSFMDSRTILAVILVAVLFVGWQSYLKNKYGIGSAGQPANPVTTTVPAANGTTAAAPTSSTTPAPAASSPAAVEKQMVSADSFPEKTVRFENQHVSFDLSSHGMGIKNVILKGHTDRDHKPMRMGVSERFGLYEMAVTGEAQPIQFELKQTSDFEFEGQAQVGANKIVRTIRINKETQAIENSVNISNMDPHFPGVTVFIPEAVHDVGSGSFLMPSFEHQEFIVVHGTTEERIVTSHAKEKIDKTIASVNLLGIGSQYFTSALVDKSEIIPEAVLSAAAENKNDPSHKEILAQLRYKPVAGQTTMELKWLAYSGGKSYTVLQSIDPQMARVVNFGFFTTIGRWLLHLLQWFHGIVGNWGVSIILLTLLVRILVLPLNVSTFKSTKKMQKLSPIIASLRERYKDDPQALNREMMNVWKEHKVNPLGGCLPMLLQLPVFFALYQVLGQSIELYQAPFFGWITDLSLKDPFYVLPALMAVSMFIQQKITPTTLDPNQARIMQFMPLIFAVMMISLPSGLTLYIFINTLSGIILQQIFMHDRKTEVVTKEAKA